MSEVTSREGHLIVKRGETSGVAGRRWTVARASRWEERSYMLGGQTRQAVARTPRRWSRTGTTHVLLSFL
jgi:hypothetical protein